MATPQRKGFMFEHHTGTKSISESDAELFSNQHLFSRFSFNYQHGYGSELGTPTIGWLIVKVDFDNLDLWSLRSLILTHTYISLDS
jgi:hypothetical protein